MTEAEIRRLLLGFIGANLNVLSTWIFTNELLNCRIIDWDGAREKTLEILRWLDELDERSARPPKSDSPKGEKDDKPSK